MTTKMTKSLQVRLKHLLSCDWRSSLIFPRNMWPLWRCLSTTRSTVGRQSSSEVFSPFKFSGWQITHLFQLQSIWRRPLRSCAAIFSLSDADWKELQCSEGPRKLIVRNVNQSRWVAPGLFPGKSHQSLTGVSLWEALENGSATPEDWRSRTRGSRRGLGLTKITTFYLRRWGRL